MSPSLLSDPRFVGAVHELAERQDRPGDAVMADAAACLAEMETAQQRVGRAIWARWATYLYSRAYRLTFDEEALARIRDLGRTHPLVFLPSHRSNLDGYVMASLLYKQGFPGNYTLGGKNMAFWPIGPLGRRSGVIWIRRSFRDDEVYKLTLRHYLGHLVRQGHDLEWYIEGGRTRTGKLLPPTLGLFTYLADAVEDHGVQGVHVIPTSIVYDELPEVEEMTTESHGAVKPPEGLPWLLRFARQQRGDYGNVQVNFGEPIDLAAALAANGSDPVDKPARRLARHKVAIEVCARINRATPATAPSLLTLALLGVEDRALTFRQVQDVLRPVLRYVIARDIPADDGARRLTTQDGVRETLATLVAHRVVDRYDGGTETVFGIGAEQALVAGFYRNISIHWFLDRAIAELALLHVADEPGDDVVESAWAEAFRLRDLLKFDFFFADREQSRADLTAEIELIEPGWREHGREHLGEIGPAMVRSGALMAPRILRSFIESHLVVADRLQALGEWPAEAGTIADDCLGLGTQYLRQRRITSRDAISLHLFSPAVKLCANYGLLDGPDLVRRRGEHAAYLHALQRRLGAAGDLAHASIEQALAIS
jgi:glycerol-3-phosphate O-acyltransferase